MNREIKFRGKRIDDGKWVHGSYTSMMENNRNNPFCQVESKIFHRIWQWEAGDWNMGGYANYEVIPETVGQYTGLKDKNGVKIYEGDIIEHTISGNISVHEVYFDNEMLEFGLRYSGELFHCQFNDEFELVGNIHDNPELLNK